MLRALVNQKVVTKRKS